jgi:hypothetical protein
MKADEIRKEIILDLEDLLNEIGYHKYYHRVMDIGFNVISLQAQAKRDVLEAQTESFKQDLYEIDDQATRW